MMNRFLTWLEQFGAALFDARIERDIRARELDRHAEEAIRAFRDGRTTEI
jgi:hypothetical protein